MTRTFVFGSAVLALVLTSRLAGADAVDCTAARCAVRAEIDAECPCGEARNHGRYLACVARVVNRAVREGRAPKACRNAINGCFIRSLCGKREVIVLCDLPGDGVSGRCRPLLASECSARQGAVVSSCCDECEAPTPTPSAAGATATPGVPIGTATPTVDHTATPTANGAATPTENVGATPTENGGTTPTVPAPTATPTVAVATATPAATANLPTATASASIATATPAPSATLPGATASSAATATPGPSAPIGVPTPSPQSTALTFALSVSIDEDTDDGPPPLTVHFTSDVSDGTPPYTYAWDFGDGSPSSSEPNPTHVYEQLGDYTATLTVTDAGHDQDSDNADITVEL